MTRQMPYEPLLASVLLGLLCDEENMLLGPLIILQMSADTPGLRDRLERL